MDRVAEGAFGEVWLGRYRQGDVAVKLLRQSLVTMSTFNSSVTSNFQKEVKILRRLRHRNVVLFYGAGAFGEQPFLVTEFAHRGSVHGLLHDPQQPLEWPRRMRFMSEAAQGMAYLHREGVVHRDLKSHNLVIAEVHWRRRRGGRGVNKQ